MEELRMEELQMAKPTQLVMSLRSRNHDQASGGGHLRLSVIKGAKFRGSPFESQRYMKRIERATEGALAMLG
jgi:hypothetical protein